MHCFDWPALLDALRFGLFDSCRETQKDEQWRDANKTENDLRVCRNRRPSL